MFGSTRVLAGDVPYKDFWAIYPPGQFYIVAAIIKLFGANLLYARIYDTLVRFMLVIAVYLIAKRVTFQWLALLSALIAGFMLAAAGFYSYAVFPAMCLGLWSIWLWLVSQEKRQNRWLVLSGILLGIAIFIRWDIGMYACASLLGGGYLALLFQGNAQSDSPGAQKEPLLDQIKRLRPIHLLTPIKQLLWVLIPILIVAFCGYGWVGLQSGWVNLFQQVFYFPTSVLHSVRWLAYPRLIPQNLIEMVPYYDIKIPKINLPGDEWYEFYFPILTLLVSFILLSVRLIRQRNSLSPNYFTTISLTVFGALLFNQALSRYDLIHVTPASILTFMVCAALIQAFSAGLHQKAGKVSLYGLLIVLTVLYFSPSLKELLNTIDSAAPWGCYSSNKKAGCVMVMKDEELAAEYLQYTTLPNELIFVGNDKHDRIFVNDIGLYYLSDRLSASRYHELYPGVATTLPVQTQIVQELQSKKVSWVVRVKMWDSNEPNGSALSSGVTYLDDFIASNYHYVVAIGNYQILKKNR